MPRQSGSNWSGTSYKRLPFLLFPNLWHSSAAGFEPSASPAALPPADTQGHINDCSGRAWPTVIHYCTAPGTGRAAQGLPMLRRCRPCCRPCCCPCCRHYRCPYRCPCCRSCCCPCCPDAPGPCRPLVMLMLVLVLMLLLLSILLLLVLTPPLSRLLLLHMLVILSEPMSPQSPSPPLPSPIPLPM